MKLAAVLAITVLGCSDDDGAANPYECIAAGGEGCFQLPTDIMYASDADGLPIPPILDCGAYEVTTSAAPVTFAGMTVDAVDRELAVPGVRLEVFSNKDFTAPLFATTSDDTGAWTATVGAMPSVAFAKTSTAGNLDILFLHHRIDVAQPQQTMMTFETATRAQVESMIELAGDRFLPGKTQLAARAYDCAGNPLGSVIANAAPVSAKNGTRLFESGVRVYYATEGDALVLARRTQLAQTSGSGGIAITNLPPGRHFIQLYGFPTEADLAMDIEGLKLVTEQEIFVFEGESRIVMPLHARL